MKETADTGSTAAPQEPMYMDISSLRQTLFVVSFFLSAVLSDVNSQAEFWLTSLRLSGYRSKVLLQHRQQYVPRRKDLMKTQTLSLKNISIIKPWVISYMLLNKYPNDLVSRPFVNTQISQIIKPSPIFNKIKMSNYSSLSL